MKKLNFGAAGFLDHIFLSGWFSQVNAALFLPRQLFLKEKAIFEEGFARENFIIQEGGFEGKEEIYE